MNDTLSSLDADIAAAWQVVENCIQGLPEYEAYLKLKRARTLIMEANAELADDTPVVPPHADPAPRPAVPPRRTKNEGVLLEIDKILAGRGKPMKTADIFEALQRAGAALPGKGNMNNLSALLFHNSERYVSHGRQGYTLKRLLTLRRDVHAILKSEQDELEGAEV
jgi:hypothetical protein